MVLNVIAIAETDDPIFLASNKESEKIKIFEEYACGGLEFMKENCYEGEDISEKLLQLILEVQDDDSRLLKELIDFADQI